MAGIDLRYYDQATDTWIAPLANGEDLTAMQVLVTQLGLDVDAAELAVTQAVSEVGTAVQTVNNMSQTVTNLQQTVTQNQQTVTEHLEETKKWVRVSQLNAQSIPNSTETSIFWENITNYNNADFLEVENGKVKLKKGLYRLIMQVVFVGNDVGAREVVIGTHRTNQRGLSGDTWLEINALLQISSDNTFIVTNVLQNSGAALNIYGSGYNSLIVEKVGDIA